MAARGSEPSSTRRRPFKRSQDYHSSSEDEVESQSPRKKRMISSRAKSRNDIEVDAASREQNEKNGTDSDHSTDDAEGSSDLEGQQTSGDAPAKRNRNNPEVFSTSISKILTSKLSTAKRADPVLSRSIDAMTANNEINEKKLEGKAARKLQEEKKLALERGRERDVMGLENATVPTAVIQEREKQLRKTAQRGVVKLFNAVRAAQVKGEAAEREARKLGVVGIAKREGKVRDLSKQGFLELIAGGADKS